MKRAAAGASTMATDSVTMVTGTVATEASSSHGEPERVPPLTVTLTTKTAVVSSPAKKQRGGGGGKKKKKKDPNEPQK